MELGTITYHLPPSWKSLLAKSIPAPLIKRLTAFVYGECKNNTVYPPLANIYQTLQLCDFENVKVVIIGQDPYHGDGQANGMSFSVNRGVSLPPSLRNIFQEISTDIGPLDIHHGDLSSWVRQGVVLLNTTLTVRAGDPMSHSGKGWEEVTDAIIKTISTEKEHVVFLLWGRHAQSKKTLIDEKKHLILQATHPSPFSAHKGFLGCKHFSKTNEYLKKHDKEPINWSELE